MMKKTFALLLPVLALAVLGFACHRGGPTSVKSPVQVDLWVMSECPYGVHAERLMTKIVTELGPRVDLRIRYIVEETEDGKLKSLHGERELAKDIAQVCVGKLFPKDQLNFINAWNAAPDQGFEPIAAFYKLDAEQIRQCIDSGEGERLLREMLPEKERLKVEGSPTIFLDGKEFEGHRSSLGLAEEICKLREKDPEFRDVCVHKPAAFTFADASPTGGGSCGKPGEAPPEGPELARQDARQFFAGVVDRAPVRITIVYPTERPSSVVEAFKQGVKKPLPAATFVEIPFPGGDAREIIERYELRWLPAFLFEKKFGESPAYHAARGLFVQVGDAYVADPILFGADRNIGRPPTPGTLDIYYNPYDQRTWGVGQLIADTIVQPKYREKKTRIEMRPVVPLDKEGQPAVEKGEAQLAECVRQTALANAFPEKLGAYLSARFNNLDGDWKEAAQKAGLDPVQVEELAADPQYPQQLAANSAAFADFQVAVNLAFVRDNQELVTVMGKRQFEELLDSLP